MPHFKQEGRTGQAKFAEAVPLVVEEKQQQEHVHTCSVCSCEFNEWAEGGTVGNFGILPVAFCPTCLACMYDMVRQMDEGFDGQE